jgi:hypothetical protein
MEKDLAFAQNILKGIHAIDRPLGRLMEMIREMSETPVRAGLMECCGEFLDVRYELEEQVRAVYPQLVEADDEDDT